MGNKTAESEFATLCARYNIWCHKWGDVRFCPNCRSPIFPKRISQQDKRPVEDQESIVDYLIFIADRPVWVECKGKHNTTSWPFSDLDIRQENFLDSWWLRGVNSAIFLSFGPGKIPDRSAWLLPYIDFAHFRLEVLGTNRKSFSYTFAKEKLIEYELVWERGGWSIPPECWIAKTFPNVLELHPLFT